MRLGKLFSAVTKIVTIPVSLGADVVTLGNFGDKSFTKRKLEKIKEDLDEVTN
jgi:hypothetical protein